MTTHSPFWGRSAAPLTADEAAAPEEFFSVPVNAAAAEDDEEDGAEATSRC